MNTKTPDQNKPGQNKPGQNNPDQKLPGQDSNINNGNGDNDKDIDKEFRHNTPHESQPERALGGSFEDDSQEETSFDPESEKLVERNTAQQTRDPVNPRNDTTARH